jgi:toxin YoeB
MAKRVVWTNTAKHQRTNILEFWYKKTGNKKYSVKISNLLRRKIRHLSKYNYLGKPTDFLNIRVISEQNYSIFYKPTRTELIIVIVWDNRQDPRKIKKYLQ